MITLILLPYLGMLILYYTRKSTDKDWLKDLKFACEDVYAFFAATKYIPEMKIGFWQVFMLYLFTVFMGGWFGGI